MPFTGSMARKDITSFFAIVVVISGSHGEGAIAAGASGAVAALVSEVGRRLVGLIVLVTVTTGEVKRDHRRLEVSGRGDSDYEEKLEHGGEVSGLSGGSASAVRGPISPV